MRTKVNEDGSMVPRNTFTVLKSKLEFLGVLTEWILTVYYIYQTGSFTYPSKKLYSRPGNSTLTRKFNSEIRSSKRRFWVLNNLSFLFAYCSAKLTHINRI